MVFIFGRKDLLERIMRKIILLLVLVSGCTTIKMTRIDPTTGTPVTASYTRWGNQEIGSFIWDTDGSILFERQKADHTEIMSKLIDRIP